MALKLTVKNLQNETFTVDCDKDDTIQKLKEKIAAKDDLSQKYDPELLKLLYKGKVMDDDETVESFEIKPDAFLLLVKQTPGKPKPPPKKKPNQGFNNFMGGGFGSNSFMQSPFQHGAFGQGGFGGGGFGGGGFGGGGFGAGGFGGGGFGGGGFGAGGFGQGGLGAGSFEQTPVGQTSYGQGAFNPSQVEQKTHIPAAAATSDLSDTSPEAFSTADDRAEALATLISMGFEQPNAEKALRASFYNVETAIEYITSGNIPDVDNKPAVPVGGGLPKPSGGPLIQGSSPGPSAVRQPGTGGGGMGANLQQMRQMLQDNPAQLQVLKQTLQAEHPEIAQLIDENPQAFLDLLQQADATGGGPLGGGPAGAPGAGRHDPGAIQVTLTPNEQQIITRLQDMGFERNRAIEAFLACDRNENLAINYLLSSFD